MAKFFDPYGLIDDDEEKKRLQREQSSSTPSQEASAENKAKESSYKFFSPDKLTKFEDERRSQQPVVEDIPEEPKRNPIQKAKTFFTDLFKKKDTEETPTDQPLLEVGEQSYTYNDLSVSATERLTAVQSRRNEIENQILDEYYDYVNKEKLSVGLPFGLSEIFGEIQTPFDTPESLKQDRETIKQLLEVNKYRTLRTDESAVSKNLPPQKKTQELANERDQLLLAEDAYREILSHDKSDVSFWEGVRDAAKEPEKLTPFVGSVVSFKELKDTYTVIEKKKNGVELTPTEKAILEKETAREIENVVNEKGLGYFLGSMVANMPTFGLEFALTGGLFSTASKGVQATSTVSKVATKSPAAAKLLGALGGITAQTTIGFAPEILEKAAEYTVDERSFAFTEEGEIMLTTLEEQQPFTEALTESLPKAYAVTWIEVGSERSGEALSALKKGMLTKFFAKHADKPVAETNKLLQTIGWNGVFEEILEEEIAELGQAPVEGREYNAPVLTEEGNQRLLLETLGIGLYGSILKVPTTAYEVTQKRNAINTVKQQAKDLGIPEEEVDTLIEELTAESEGVEVAEYRPPETITREKDGRFAKQSAKDLVEGNEPAVEQEEEEVEVTPVENRTDAQGKVSAPENIKPTAEQVSQIAENSFLNNSEDANLKSNRLQEGGVSIKEAETGLAQNGQDLDKRIGIGVNDSGNLVLTDGRHLLEAYRRGEINLPTRKLFFENAEAENLFVSKLNELSGNLSEDQNIESLEGKKLYHGTEGTVRTATKSYENVLKVEGYQLQLLEQMAREGNTDAQAVLNNRTGSKIDFTSADKVIREFYKGKYDAIQYTNNVAGRKPIGNEFHDLGENIFYAENEDTAKAYASQRGRKLKHENQSKTKDSGGKTDTKKKKPAKKSTAKSDRKTTRKSRRVSAPKGFANDGNFADIQSAKKAVDGIRPVQFPELVKLTRELTGLDPKVNTRLRKVLGRALLVEKGGVLKSYGTKSAIELSPEIFQDEQVMTKTLAHELGHITDYLSEGTTKRGNLVGRIASLRGHLKQKFGNLNDAVLRKELENLTQLWKPFDVNENASYTKYRHSSVELYADAISVLFNDPALLKQEAPTFYENFFEHIDSKPEVKENFFNLWNLLNKGEEIVLNEREKDIRDMFERGEDLFRAKVAEKSVTDRELAFRLKFELIDKNQRVIDKVNELKKKGVEVSDEANPVYWLEEQNYVGGVVKNFVEENFQPIYDSMESNEITWEDLGEVLFLERVVNERGELANPLGQTKSTAEAQLKYLEKQLGEKRWNALQKALGDYRKANDKVLKMAEDEGFYRPELIKEMKANPAYATYQVLDYLDTNISASIKQQVGTLKDIANPASSTVIKAVSMIRAIERNKTKKSIVKFMKEYYPQEISEAKYAYNGKARIPQESRDSKLALFTTMEDGKFTGYYVDPYIAKTMEWGGTGHANAVIEGLRFFNSGLFRPLFITFNLGFQSFNLMRDFSRFYKNTPNLPLWRAFVRYGQSLKPAARRAWSVPDSTIKEMEQSKMMGITYNDVVRGFSEEDQQIDFILAKVGLSPLEGKKTATFLKPFKAVLDTIEKTGNLIETEPKVAGYKELNGKLPRGELGSFIRTSVGSPDFMRKGANYRVYNEIFLFSNAIKEGIRADINVATNPRTRGGWMFKTAWTTITPKLIMWGMLAGFFGDELRKMFENVSEYDMTNYIIVPLSIDKNGKTVYIRVPQDETGRFIGGLFWKALRANNNNRPFMRDVADVFSYAGGQLPSTTPILSVARATAQYLAGENPYDYFRGRNVIPDAEFEAGGYHAFKPFAIWAINSVGGNVFLKSYTSMQAPETRTWTQKVIEAPVLSNIVGRWVKVSDYGKTEKNRQIISNERQEQAKERLEVNRKVDDAIREYREGAQNTRARSSMEKKLVNDIYGKPPYDSSTKAQITNTVKKFRIGIVKGEADPKINSLISATTNREKLALLVEIERDMDGKEFAELRTKLIREGIVSRNVFIELSRQGK